MRATLRRALVWGAAAALALVAGIIVVVHLPVVQRAAWERGAEAVGRATGWQIEAAEFRARLWPATVELRGLRAGAPDPGAVVADRVAVRFRWGGVLASPRRIEAIEIEGMSVDLRGLDLPRTEPDPNRPAADPWHSIEIGSLEVRGARLGAAASDVELGLDEVELSGGIEDGMAHLAARIGAIVAVRQGRRLVVGPLEVVASASEQGVEVERLDLAGEVASGSITLSTGFADRRLAGGGRFELELQPAIEWFEPDLATLLQPRGRLVLSGTGEVSAGSDLKIALEHVGGPLGLAGYGITRLRLSSTPTGVLLDAGGDEWGEVAVDLARDRAAVHARFAGAAAGPAVALAVSPEPYWMPGPLTLYGTVDATVPLPVSVQRLAAAARPAGGVSRMAASSSKATARAPRGAPEGCS